MLASAWLILPAALLFIFRLGKYQQFANHIHDRIIVTAVNAAAPEAKPVEESKQNAETTGLADDSYAP